MPSIIKELDRIFLHNNTGNSDRYFKEHDFLQKEVDELLKRKIKHALELGYQLEQMGDKFSKLKQMVDLKKNELREMTAKKNNNGYLWITINPMCQVKLIDFIKKVQKIVKYSCFTETLYVFEQRGTLLTNDVGKGFHAHILAKRNLAFKPSKCKDQIRRGCKTLVKNINDPRWVNLAAIGAEFATDKTEYMLGCKKIEKQAKQKADAYWRCEQNLKASYGKIKI